MKTHVILLFFVGSVSFVKAQDLNTITGTITGDDDIENIHVINKSSNLFTVSNVKGEFSIGAKLNDTIVFTAIQYSTKEVVITSPILISKSMHIFLNEEVNKLEEVVVGKILTGNLMLDVGNSTAEPEINFYDVGIPGYKGKPKSQSERRLHVAQTGDLDPLLNAISGLTKILEGHVDLEKRDELINKIRQRLSEDFFSEHPLNKFKQMDFWYFCADDPNFNKRCNRKSDIEILAFLNEKYHRYLANSNSTTD